MSYKFYAFLFFVFFSNEALSASDMANTRACIDKAKRFASVTLEPFPTKYDNNLFTKDLVLWNNATCKVSFEDVYELIVNKEVVVYKGFAGMDAYDFNDLMYDATKKSKDILESRLNQIDKIRKLKTEISLLKEKRSSFRSQKWEITARAGDRYALDKRDKNKLENIESNLMEIDTRIHELEIAYGNTGEVRTFNKKKELLDKVRSKIELNLKNPYPDLVKIASFAETSVNKLLRKNQNDDTNYFSGFYIIPEVNNDFSDLEKELQEFEN